MSFDLIKFKSFFFKFLYLFFFQFIILFFIFLLSTEIIELENSILFSLIVTMSTDLSFIFTITPYAIGISETFIFFSSNNFNIKLSEILLLQIYLGLACFWFIYLDL